MDEFVSFVELNEWTWVCVSVYISVQVYLCTLILKNATDLFGI